MSIYQQTPPSFSGRISRSPTFSNMIAITHVLMVMDMLMKLLGLAGNLVRMTTTPLLALMALSFFMALSFLEVMGMCAWIAMLLPSVANSYPRLMFASIVGITFMVMKNMFELGTPLDQSVLASGSFSTLPSFFTHMKATLVGLAIFINDYRVAHLVMRAGASTLGLDDFVGVSEHLSMEHKMVMEKIVSGLNTLIEVSMGAVQSFFVHTILIMMTLIGGMVFFVLSLYRSCMHILTEKSKQLLDDRVPLLVDTLTEKTKELLEDRGSALADTIGERSNAMIEKAALEVHNLIQDQKYRSSFGLLGKKRPGRTPRVDGNAPRRIGM